jgi:hypothetical protein
MGSELELAADTVVATRAMGVTEREVGTPRMQLERQELVMLGVIGSVGHDSRKSRERQPYCRC